MTNLEKMCSTFLHFTHEHLILVHNFEHGKIHFEKHCMQFWVYVNKFFLTLCVTHGRGPTHWNVLIMFFLKVVRFIFTKSNSKKEKICLVKGWDQHFLMYKIKQY
jgi:hypothetical protein